MRVIILYYFIILVVFVVRVILEFLGRVFLLYIGGECVRFWYIVYLRVRLLCDFVVIGILFILVFNGLVIICFYFSFEMIIIEI